MKVRVLYITLYGHGQEKEPMEFDNRVASNPGSWFLSGHESNEKVSRPLTHKHTNQPSQVIHLPQASACCGGALGCVALAVSCLIPKKILCILPLTLSLAYLCS